MQSILGSLKAYGQRISFASSRIEVLQGTQVLYFRQSSVVVSHLLSSVIFCHRSSVVIGHLLSSVICCLQSSVVIGHLLSSVICCRPSSVVVGHLLLWVICCRGSSFAVICCRGSSVVVGHLLSWVICCRGSSVAVICCRRSSVVVSHLLSLVELVYNSLRFFFLIRLDWRSSDQTVKLEVPYHSQRGRIKSPPYSKPLGANDGPNFCSPSPTVMTFLYDGSILTRDVENPLEIRSIVSRNLQYTTQQTIKTRQKK